jgi:hypothetical protein
VTDPTPGEVWQDPYGMRGRVVSVDPLYITVRWLGDDGGTYSALRQSWEAWRRVQPTLPGVEA